MASEHPITAAKSLNVLRAGWQFPKHSNREPNRPNREREAVEQASGKDVLGAD